MALKHSFELNGNTYDAAYSRVVYVLCYKDEARVFVNTYHDTETRQREAADTSVLPIFQKEYVVPVADMVGDQFPCAYEHLKTLPEFEAAEDC